MSAPRLKALLHATKPAQQPAQQRNSPLLHVAPPRECNTQQHAQDRQAKALQYLEAHPEAIRACFADVESDPANFVLTVALREPWGAVEVLVKRERFDAMA